MEVTIALLAMAVYSELQIFLYMSEIDDIRLGTKASLRIQMPS